MKRSKNGNGKKLELRRERLRQLDKNELEQVGGGWDWYRTCMGTWAAYYNP